MSIRDDTLLSMAETAAELDVTYSTIQRYLRNGYLARVRHAGRSYVSRSELEDYWSRQEAAGKKERAAVARQTAKRNGKARRCTETDHEQ